MPRRLLLPLASLLSVVLAAVVWASPEPEEPAVTRPPNRLAKSRSPYLRQHALNPVDWYPWGEEALQRAEKEQRLIFLSVGYAACHWCHVMEHECFEDEGTAQRLNEAFVCIKVDREERPDLDRLYMNAVHVMQQRGGWPMTVLLTPDGKPFWAGTYLPREGLHRLIEQVQALWAKDRERVLDSAARVADVVASMTKVDQVPQTEDSETEVFKTLRNALAADFDSTSGGYGGRPKFPPHSDLLLLLEESTDELVGKEELRQALKTLDAMEEGGIHDQVGGGFHRYSTDERWLLPHFEKMLYDNALLAQAYARAFARSGDERYRRVVQRLCAWVERELAQPGGGYASSLDADTEGEEGLTYTWTVEEVRAALAPAEVDLVTRLFGFDVRGNFQDEATHRTTGRNIPHLKSPLATSAKAQGLSPSDLQAQLDRSLAQLLSLRNQRAQPALDEKVISSWNGLWLSALANAGRDLADPALVARAKELAQFLLQQCRRPDGVLLRFPRASGPEIVGFCEDHVHVAHGLLDLEAVTGERAYGDVAQQLGLALVSGFCDVQEGGFFTTASTSHESLFARTKEAWDSPIPSDNGSGARLCLRLYARQADERFLTAADGTLKLYHSMMAHPRMVRGVAALLQALRLRMALTAAGVVPARRGDVHRALDTLTIDLFQERGTARAGGVVALSVRLTIAPGWHLTAPGDATGVAVELFLAPGSPVRLRAPEYPVAERRALVPGATEQVALYAGEVQLRAALEVPDDATPGPRKVPLRLRVQACSDDGTCQAPLDIELDLALRVDTEEGPVLHPRLFEAR